jgi:hypothetical protein
MPSNRRWRQRHSSRRREEEQEPQHHRAVADRAARGRAQLGRRAEAMVTHGGKTGKLPQLDEGARGGRANAPHGDGGDRRSTPESSGEVDSDSQSPGEQERLGLGLSRGRERGWARLVRSNPLGLT